MSKRRIAIIALALIIVTATGLAAYKLTVGKAPSLTSHTEEEAIVPTVVVDDLRAPPAPGPPPPLPPGCGDRYVDATEAVQLIQNCKIPLMFQPHEGPVILQLTDGTSVCSRQPKIDYLPRVAAVACPQFPIVVLVE